MFICFDRIFLFQKIDRKQIANFLCYPNTLTGVHLYGAGGGQIVVDLFCSDDCRTVFLGLHTYTVDIPERLQRNHILVIGAPIDALVDRFRRANRGIQLNMLPDLHCDFLFRQCQGLGNRLMPDIDFDRITDAAAVGSRSGNFQSEHQHVCVQQPACRVD